MRTPLERFFMRLFPGFFAGLVLAGILAIAPTAAFAHGGGGGGHGGGGGGFGGGHGGGGGHFAGGGGHFAGFAGRSFGGHSFAERRGGHFEHGDRFRPDRDFFFGGPFLYDYPYYVYDTPHDGYAYPYPY